MLVCVEGWGSGTSAPFFIVSEHQHQQHSHQCGQTYQQPQAGCVRARVRQGKALAVVNGQGNVVHAAGGILGYLVIIRAVEFALPVRCQRKLDGFAQQGVALGGFGFGQAVAAGG